MNESEERAKTVADALFSAANVSDLTIASTGASVESDDVVQLVRAVIDIVDQYDHEQAIVDFVLVARYYDSAVVDYLETHDDSEIDGGR